MDQVDWKESYLAVRWTYQQCINSKVAMKQPCFLVYYGLGLGAKSGQIPVVGLITSKYAQLINNNWCSRDQYSYLSNRLDELIDTIKARETQRMLLMNNYNYPVVAATELARETSRDSYLLSTSGGAKVYHTDY